MYKKDLWPIRFHTSVYLCSTFKELQKGEVL